MNDNENQTIVSTLVKAFAIVAIFAIGAVIAAAVGASKADAADRPYGTCREAWQEPFSPGADDCRQRGWTITRHLLINPHNVRAWTDFEACEFEDSTRCFWNARTRGNHHGRSFVNHGNLGTFYGMDYINGRYAGAVCGTPDRREGSK